MRDLLFLILPEVEILDLGGPLQAFGEANRDSPRYRIRFCGPRADIRTSQGLELANIEPLPDAAGDVTIVIPGMPYRVTEHIERSVIRWLKASAAAGADIASVCTGAFVAGEAGLLDGRRCTTHWSRTRELQCRFPAARVMTNRLYVTDGNVTTAGGIASGIDMALAMIEQAHGPVLASQVAREMVVYLRRDGAHEQQSVYLDYRTHLHPGIHRVQDWIIQHPDDKLTLPSLGDLAGMSARNLTRLFRRLTGISIHDFATRVRLELARTLLHDPTLTLDGVAARSGFTTGRQLRRVWKQTFGAPPSEARP